MKKSLSESPRKTTLSRLYCSERFRRILYIICKSETPLSSTQIFNEMNDKFHDNSPYTYKVIEKLCPMSDFFLSSGYAPTVRFLNFISKKKSSERAIKAEIEYAEVKDAYHKGTGSMEKLEPVEKRYFKELRRDYRYYPNLRTLLLYFYNEYHAKTTKTKKVDRIRKVLSNPKIIEIAPFLEYWNDFQKYGFNVIDIFYDLLMEIGEELRNQLCIKAENDTYLIRRVTERIFSEVELNVGFILDPPGDFFFIKKEGMKKYNKLAETRKQYRKLLISFQRGWLEEKRKYLDFYEQE
jgi:hypothetical protein